MAIVKAEARGKGTPQRPQSRNFFLQADLMGVLWPDTFRVRHAISLRENSKVLPKASKLKWNPNPTCNKVHILKRK